MGEDLNQFFTKILATKKPPKDTHKVSEKSKLTDIELQIQEYVANNSTLLKDKLPEIIEKYKFTLIGENYVFDCEPIRQEIVKVLPDLKKRGLTHVMVEVPNGKQDFVDNLDYTDKDVANILKKNLSSFISSGVRDIMIMSKLLGLKLVCIDEKPDNSHANNTFWQNKRDGFMFETLQKNIDENSKVLIFIGDGHIHKSPTKTFDGVNYVTRIGTLLNKKYENQVCSVRNVLPNFKFDGLFLSKKSTSPSRISVGKNEIVIIPDDGLVKGDPRITNADYIVTKI